LGLTRKASFSDVSSNAEINAELATAYGGDIDLCDPWICGLGEDAVDGVQLGELFSTIISDQCQRLMDGALFFYLNDADVTGPQMTRVIDITHICLADMINLNTAGGIGSDTMLA
jgi:hypothetical protein